MADVHERAARLRVGQVRLGEDFRVELVLDIVLLEALAVHLVHLDRTSGPARRQNSRTRARPAPPTPDGPRGTGCGAPRRLHEPVDLVDDRERLARPRRHREQACDACAPTSACSIAVLASAWYGRKRAFVCGNASTRSLSAASSSRPSCSRSASGVWKCATCRERLCVVANVVMPDHLAIRRVQERDAKLPPETAWWTPSAYRSACDEHVLRPKRELLRLNDAHDAAAQDERVVRRAIRVGYSSTAQRSNPASAICTYGVTRQPAARNSLSTRCFARHPFRLCSSTQRHLCRPHNAKTRDVCSGLKSKYIPQRLFTPILPSRSFHRRRVVSVIIRPEILINNIETFSRTKGRNGGQRRFMARGPVQRTLTIYLINKGVRDAAAIIRPGTEQHPVTVGETKFGDLYVHLGAPHPPPWVSFFNENAGDLSYVQGMSTSAVYLVEAGRRLFAITFGFGRLLLQPGVVDNRFGLRVTLNAVDHQQIRSIDRETLDSPAPHSQIQARVAANINKFGLDLDQDLLRAVTGIPRDTTLGKRLTGKDALRTTGPFTLEGLPPLLRRYLAESKKTEYREHFPWLDHIQEVKNPTLRTALDEALQERLQQQEFDGMWLAIPERVEWQDIDHFAYRENENAEHHADIHLRTFTESLRDPASITIEAIKNRYRVYAVNDSGNHTYEWPVYACLYAELTLDAKQYLLNSSTWYRVDNTFRTRIENAYTRIPKNKVVLPNAEPDEIERVYNERVANNNPAYALMDRKIIRYPDRNSQIEFCDLYSDNHAMIHVKPYAGSSTLSHLFAQGVTSGTMYAHDAGFRKAVNTKLPNTHLLARPIEPLPPKTYAVVYAIISSSNHALNIPFFSKVTLHGAAKTLRSVGYNVQLTKIATNP